MGIPEKLKARGFHGHRHGFRCRLGMPGLREERSFFFSNRRGKATSLGIQERLEQGESMGQGTTSDADWACRGDGKNVHFCKIEKGELQVWVYKTRFEQGDSIGTGTTSDADRACRGHAYNVHFFR